MVSSLDWVAHRNGTVKNAQWLAKMRPENMYKALFNEGTLGREEILIVTLKDPKEAWL